MFIVILIKGNRIGWLDYMNQILCCVNASAHSRPAIRFAVELAAALGAQISFLTVNEVKPATGFPPIKNLTDSKIQEILNVAKAYAATCGVRSVKRIVSEHQDAATAILECAKQIGADHIVVGTGNPSPVGRLLLGSVSQAVVTSAECNVTVAR